MRRSLRWLTAAGVLFAHAGAGADAGKGKPSVVLVIGDGLGVSLQEALRKQRGALAVDEMAYAAIVRTHAEDAAVTDSAAAATAMATGRKTKNGYLARDASGKPIRTVVEDAKAAGKKIGLVTTSYLWDATPAAFVTHVADRYQTDEVSLQFLRFGPDVLFGGGAGYLLPATAESRFGPGLRSDGRDVFREFARAGYALVTAPEPGPLPRMGLFAQREMFTDFPSTFQPAYRLPEMTQAALASLEGAPDGFFLLVEEEGPDEMLHGANVEDALKATADWDDTVRVLLAFHRRHPETAIVVTSDHETGGFVVAPPGVCEAALSQIDKKAFTPKYTADLSRSRYLTKDQAGHSMCLRAWSNLHTSEPVPLFAEGIKPLRTVMDNTEIYGVLRQALGLDAP